MLRKRASSLLGAGKSHKTSQPQKHLAPARTLILQSPMSGSMTELNETCEFEFGHGISKHTEFAHMEPLFNDTFYLSSPEDASPLSSHSSISPVWAFQKPSITVSPAAPVEVPEVPSISYKELHTLTEDLFVATTIRYIRAGKVNVIEITMKRSRETSRSSSISTHDTIFSTYNDHKSITSTPTSSVYDQSFYSPITAPSSPDFENKPFRKVHEHNDSASLDSIEERPKDFVPQPVLIKTPTLERKEKSGVQITTTEILPSAGVDRPSTPNKLRRSKMSVSEVWYRR